MEKLVFATNNAHKLSEIRAILGDKIEILSLAEIDCHDDIPETADTLRGNALQKAQWVYERYGYDCFADDTGLEVDALGGAPGVHTARYASEAGHDSEANTRKLLKELNGVPEAERTARFRTAIALIMKRNGGEPVMFDGVVEGFIATEKRGTDGFGYDPVFAPELTLAPEIEYVPADNGKTFAELGIDTKNTISHRARATAMLAQYLSENCL